MCMLFCTIQATNDALCLTNPTQTLVDTLCLLYFVAAEGFFYVIGNS